MGQFWSQYSPFTVYGQYNIKEKLYQQKRIAIAVLIIIILVILVVINMIWSSDASSDTDTKIHYTIPPPRQGKGPYGGGIYLPTKELLASSIATQ